MGAVITLAILLLILLVPLLIFLASRVQARLGAEADATAMRLPPGARGPLDRARLLAEQRETLDRILARLDDLSARVEALEEEQRRKSG